MDLFYYFCVVHLTLYINEANEDSLDTSIVRKQGNTSGFNSKITHALDANDKVDGVGIIDESIKDNECWEKNQDVQTKDALYSVNDNKDLVVECVKICFFQGDDARLGCVLRLQITLILM